MREYRLLKNIPMLRKGRVYVFDDETGFVYWKDETGYITEYSLKQGLAGYLWLLLTEKGYFRRIKDKD